MDLFFHIILICISFSIAFLGVVILFNFDALTGFTLSALGIILSLRTIGRV